MTDSQSERRDRMLRWLFFVALIAALPTLLSLLVTLATDRIITWRGLFGRGELVVGALALAADTAGGLTKGSLQGRKLLVFCFCILMSIVMASVVSLNVTGVIQADNSKLADLSVYSFVMAFMISAVGKWIAEE